MSHAIVVISNGGLVVKDPADSKVYLFDWDVENLPGTIQITTSVWTITAIAPSTTDAILTKDSEARLSAADATLALGRTIVTDNRVTVVRLIAGTLGQTYEIANKVTTSETPNQIKERSFRILVEQQ